MRTLIPGQPRKSTAAPSPAPGEPVAILSPDDGSAAAAGVEPQIDAPRATAGLSNEQKAQLAILARRAYDKHKEAGLIDDDVTFDAWRGTECIAATRGRVTGFRGATNRDYRQIRGHFALLAGEVETAFHDAVNGTPEQADWEQAWNILSRETMAKGHAFPAYPAAICNQQYKCPLREATKKQLWSLIYTIRSRKESKAKG